MHKCIHVIHVKIYIFDLSKLFAINSDSKYINEETLLIPLKEILCSSLAVNFSRTRIQRDWNGVILNIMDCLNLCFEKVWL